MAPEDLELAFTLASGYLRLGRPESAEPLFAEVAAARRAPQTHVLIGRAYRDFGHHDRARIELSRALEMDPRARRARYYLGTLALLDPDGPDLDAAIGELRQELAAYPDDRPTLLLLGMALVEAQRYEEALPALERSAAPPADAEATFYLGRCQLALGQAERSAETLRRALALAAEEGTDPRRVQGIEYQLALALRRQGKEAEAAPHFAAAARLSSALAERSRDRLARYLSDEAEPVDAGQLALSSFLSSWAQALPAGQRDALWREVDGALARSLLNLGVLQLRASGFARAVELLAAAAELEPTLAGLPRALGVARFNAGQHAAAVEPLESALADEPDDELRRLLALAHLESGGFARAAELLAGDPGRASDPSLQFTYGMALVRGGQPAEAEKVFRALLRDHTSWPELHVLLGQAHASQSDYEAATASLRLALELSPTVAEAHLALGTIFLRQGKLAEAEGELRAELANRPGDRQARHQLATVLELAGRQEEAIAELRAVLESSPSFADGRYLMGKMLLARGDAEGAVLELEQAAQLAPADANVRYQLGQAYQKLGRVELARQAFDAYRELKRGEREESP